MIYFVGEEYLKKQTGITANCDVTDIAPWVKPAAEVRLIPIIGDHFFNYLLTKYNAGTLSADELVLMKKIKPVVAWRAAAMAVYALSRPLKNIGLQKLNSENSDGVELSEVNYGMQQYNQVASMYQSMLIKYIVRKRDLYPEFMSDENDDAEARKGCVEDIDEGYGDTIMFIGGRK